MVDRALSRRRPDAGGVLLQSAGRRPARHHRSPDADMTAVPALAVEDLSVEFRTRSGTVKVLERVAFEVDKGETLALVGEPGPGQPVTGFAVMGLLDPAGAGNPGAAVVRG